MKRFVSLLGLFAIAVLLLGGCAMRTVDQMYCLPKRSEEYNSVQSAIDREMASLEYCAPLSGEHQQSVQMADLTGDGVPEYILFAKGSGDKPLRILVFRQTGDDYTLAWSIQSSGTAFEQVEYAQMDDRDGLEMVVGCQLSNQVLRSVSVYSFADGQDAKMLSVNYTRFLTYDLDGDALSELLVLRPGQQEVDNGVAELYSFQQGQARRSTEVAMSEPADQIKRIVTGRLEDGPSAVFVASLAGENAIITDVFSVIKGSFTNVSLSNESGTSVQTLRSYYVYADDIDEDGVVELPSLVAAVPSRTTDPEQQYLVRWYAMTASGAEVDKLFTYHNFADGWYLQLDADMASRVEVLREQEGSAAVSYSFYVWDDSYAQQDKVLTLYVLTGDDREDEAARDNRFVVYSTDHTIYAARLEAAGAVQGLTSEEVGQAFHLIHRDWKTGET